MELRARQRFGAWTLVRCVRTDEHEQTWLAQHPGPPPQMVGIRLRERGANTTEDPFGRECELAPWLEHENILRILESCEDGPLVGLVHTWMSAIPLVEVQPALEELRARDEAGFLAIVLHVVESVLRALDHAHAVEGVRGMPQGIVHGTLSPGHVLLADTGVVAVTGFGMRRDADDDPSRVMERGLDALRYAAPEQLGTRNRPPSIDLFAAGALLHELLDGRPFRADLDGTALYQSIVRADIPTLSRAVPDDIDAVRLALLAASARSRPADAADALTRVRGCARAPDAIAKLGALVTSIAVAQAQAARAQAETSGPPMLDEVSEPARAEPAARPVIDEGTLLLDDAVLAAMRKATSERLRAAAEPAPTPAAPRPRTPAQPVSPAPPAAPRVASRPIAAPPIAAPPIAALPIAAAPSRPAPSPASPQEPTMTGLDARPPGGAPLVLWLALAAIGSIVLGGLTAYWIVG